MRLTRRTTRPVRTGTPTGARARRCGARGLRCAAGALLLVLGAGCRTADAGTGGEAGTVGAPQADPPAERTLVTIDPATVTDCATLAGGLATLFSSLGPLSADEASRLDPVIIRAIGEHLDAVEARRSALRCDEAAWREDTCAALATAHSPMAERMLGSSCAVGQPASATVTAQSGPQPAVTGSTARATTH